MKGRGHHARTAALLLMILGGAATPAAGAGDEGRGTAAARAEAAAAPSSAAMAAAAAESAALEPAAPEPAAPEPAAPEPAAAERVVEPYPWRSPRPTVPNWDGASRDAFYFVSYQIFGVAVLYVLPQSVSGWSDEDKSNFTLEQWVENVTNPVVWDGDTFVVNWVLHPYWGATYYTRARERGLSPTSSFVFSAAVSALWEYGAEAIAEPVSIQDLVFTPVLGALLGAYVFEPWRDRIRARQGELDWIDHAVLALTDPLGVINAKLNQWLGIRGEGMQLQLALGRPARQTLAMPGGPAPLLATPPARKGRTWGFTLHMAW